MESKATWDAIRNKLDKIALGFRSDLAEPIEQNRRHSRAMSRILRLRFGQSRPEDEMQDVKVISNSILKTEADVITE